jgi:hypothetical protein
VVVGRTCRRVMAPPISRHSPVSRWPKGAIANVCSSPGAPSGVRDVQGDNLLVAGDGERSLALVDWQLTTAARPVLDLADFMVAYLDTSERRRHEDRLLGIYHSVLTERDVADYSLEQCRDDYGMALLLPASRLATAVGLHPGLTATPDGFWNVVFPRYARALTDLGVSELLEQHYG